MTQGNHSIRRGAQGLIQYSIETIIDSDSLSLNQYHWAFPFYWDLQYHQWESINWFIHWLNMRSHSITQSSTEISGYLIDSLIRALISIWGLNLGYLIQNSLIRWPHFWDRSFDSLNIQRLSIISWDVKWIIESSDSHYWDIHWEPQWYLIELSDRWIHLFEIILTHSIGDLSIRGGCSIITHFLRYNMRLESIKSESITWYEINSFNIRWDSMWIKWLNCEIYWLRIHEDPHSVLYQSLRDPLSIEISIHQFQSLLWEVKWFIEIINELNDHSKDGD